MAKQLNQMGQTKGVLSFESSQNGIKIKDLTLASAESKLKALTSALAQIGGQASAWTPKDSCMNKIKGHPYIDQYMGVL